MEDAKIINLKSEDERTKIEGKIIAKSKSGYGFITSIEIPFKRIFFHWTALKNDGPGFLDVKIGDRVRFTPIELNEKGWRAVNVEII
jgi:cold shock CspA family protein